MKPFAKKVLRVVADIPLGEVRSYRWVAKKAGFPRAWRAVGTALRNNPWPLLIPCHRVVKSCGDPGDYSRGKNKKRTLIKLEQEIKRCLRNKE